MAEETEKESNKKPVDRNKFNRRFGRGLILMVSFGLVFWGASPFITFGFNTSSSVEGRVFIIAKFADPRRGDLFAFRPPENDFYNRRYFVKYVGGMGGDYIEKDGRSFYVNGQFVGSAKELSSNEIPLEASSAGIIPEHYYWAYTHHESSFDSRYAQIGVVPDSSVIGRVYRLF